jgi:hypothetical protein
MDENEKHTVLADSSIAPIDKPQPDDENIYIDPVKERRLLWKCDVHLTSLLTLSFLSAYLDRSNIGNAAVAGMLPDLGMSSQDLASMNISRDS